MPYRGKPTVLFISQEYKYEPCYYRDSFFIFLKFFIFKIQRQFVIILIIGFASELEGGLL